MKITVLKMFIKSQLLYTFVIVSNTKRRDAPEKFKYVINTKIYDEMI